MSATNARGQWRLKSGALPSKISLALKYPRIIAVLITVYSRLYMMFPIKLAMYLNMDKSTCFVGGIVSLLHPHGCWSNPTIVLPMFVAQTSHEVIFGGLV